MKIGSSRRRHDRRHSLHVSAPPPKKYSGYNNLAYCAGYRENIHQSQTPCQQPLGKLVEFRLKTRIEKESERAERTHSFDVTWSPNNLRDCYGIRIARETVKQLQILKASCQKSGETSGGSFPVFLGSRAQATYSRSCSYYASQSHW